MVDVGKWHGQVRVPKAFLIAVRVRARVRRRGLPGGGGESGEDGALWGVRGTSEAALGEVRVERQVVQALLTKQTLYAKVRTRM